MDYIARCQFYNIGVLRDCDICDDDVARKGAEAQKKLWPTPKKVIPAAAGADGGEA